MQAAAARQFLQTRLQRWLRESWPNLPWMIYVGVGFATAAYWALGGWGKHPILSRLPMGLAALLYPLSIVMLWVRADRDAFPPKHRRYIRSPFLVSLGFGGGISLFSFSFLPIVDHPSYGSTFFIITYLVCFVGVSAFLLVSDGVERLLVTAVRRRQLAAAGAVVRVEERSAQHRLSRHTLQMGALLVIVVVGSFA